MNGETRMTNDEGQTSAAGLLIVIRHSSFVITGGHLP
jgi:hypothetical protein